MRIALEINYEVEDDDEETVQVVEQIIGQEGRRFATTLSERLENEGVRDISLSVK